MRHECNGVQVGSSVSFTPQMNLCTFTHKLEILQEQLIFQVTTAIVISVDIIKYFVHSPLQYYFLIVKLTRTKHWNTDNNPSLCLRIRDFSKNNITATFIRRNCEISFKIEKNFNLIKFLNSYSILFV